MKKGKDGVKIEVGGNVNNSNIIDGDGNVVNVHQYFQHAIFQPSIHQLPSPPADFLGREEALAQLLMQERSAISGLSGLGGVGKTALGLVAAHELAKTYPDAQFFLDLHGASQNPLTAPEAMRQVILSFNPTTDLRPYNDDQLKGLYTSLLSGKRALLFFDNAHDAAQIRPLLPPPGCGVLVTSRTHFTLPGMGEPLRLDVLPEVEAVSLLITICSRITQHASAIAALCAYLPLALRIAATFLAEHPDWMPAEYLEKLGKQRLKTLKAEGDPAQDVEAVFELSYAQLSVDEQREWRALSVFTAPFTRSALAAVAGLDEGAVRDLAGKLNRMSLLEFNAETTRYSMHDLLRDFAAVRMDAQEDFDAHMYHAEFFMDVAGQANTLYKQGHDNILRGLASFDREWVHIQTAQAWAEQNLENGAAEAAMRLPNAGAYLLDLRILPHKQIRWLETALRASRFLKNKQAESLNLGNLGLAYFNLGETRRAIEFYEQSLAIAREIGDMRSEEASLGNLGLAHYYLGEINCAREFYEQALVIARTLDDKRSEGQALNNMGLAHFELGETRHAIEFYEQDLALTREIGDKRGEGEVLGSLGAAHFDLGETHRAIEFYEQALAIAREIGNKYGEETALVNLGVAYLDLGETHRALEFYTKALGINYEIGNRRSEGTILFNMGLANQVLGDLALAHQLGQQALEIFVAIESPLAEETRKWLESLGEDEGPKTEDGG